jgi:hypothetical protein
MNGCFNTHGRRESFLLLLNNTDSCIHFDAFFPNEIANAVDGQFIWKCVTNICIILIYSAGNFSSRVDTRIAS